MSANYLGNDTMPRGLKNNNPGNLVLTDIAWKGKISNDRNTDGHFEQFQKLHFGIRAMMRDIVHDINKGLDNLNDLVAEYAPPHENDTTNYVNFVANEIGIQPNDKFDLTQSFLLALVKAKIAMENGRDYAEIITDEDYQDAIDILGIELPKGGDIKEVTDESKSFLHCPSCSAKLIVEVNKSND